MTLAENAQGTTFTDPGPLVSGQTYYYIWAMNADGPSYDGAWNVVTAQGEEFGTAPGAPRSVRRDPSAPDGQLKLIWDAPADGSATRYVVVMHEIGDNRPNGSWRPVEMDTVTSTSFIHHLTAEDFPDDGIIFRNYYVYSVTDDGLRSVWPGPETDSDAVVVGFFAQDCEGCAHIVRPPR